MRAVVQRVSEARVEVEEGDGSRRTTGQIGAGFLILLGVKKDDSEEDARWLADKIAGLRVFADEEGKMNRSLMEAGGAALVVSQFTLYGDCRKGRRPSFVEAAGGETARDLYAQFGGLLTAQGVPVQWGEFGATMHVALTNEGPITLLLDSRRTF